MAISSQQGLAVAKERVKWQENELLFGKGRYSGSMYFYRVISPLKMYFYKVVSPLKMYFYKVVSPLKMYFYKAIYPVLPLAAHFVGRLRLGVFAGTRLAERTKS